VKNVAHLESCTLCRALDSDDEPVQIEHRPLNVDALPLATWEGASHRTWPLVAAGLVSILVLAVALFLAAGTPPLRGIAHAVTSSFTSYSVELSPASQPLPASVCCIVSPSTWISAIRSASSIVGASKTLKNGV
jgi:hypothetical protein